jgi:hypothetical protein
MKIAASLAERSLIEEEFQIVRWSMGVDTSGTPNGTWIGYEPGDTLPAEVLAPPTPPTPPVKTWAGAGEFFPEFTLEEHAAVEALAPTDALIRAGLARLAAAPVIRADSEVVVQMKDYLLTFDPPPVTAERWAEILGA